MYRKILVIFIGLKFIVENSNDCLASVQVPQNDESDYPPQRSGIGSSSGSADIEKLEQLQLPKDQVALVRLPSNTLLKYTAYKDVSILHFRIPPDTRTAMFSFKAYEESKSAFQRVCQPRDVTLHLKAGSYPVISPENITFPKTFLNADQRFKIYNLQFKSNGRQQRLSVDGPQSGNWFAVAFISWTDPNNDRIEQQGLAASCETLLLSEMSVARILPTILQNGQYQNGTLTTNTSISDPYNSTRNEDSTNNGNNTMKNNSKNNSSSSSSNSSNSSSSGINTNSNSSTNGNNSNNSYKFYVPRNVGIVTARITIGNICLKCPDVGFYVQANALPSDANYIHSSIIKPNQTGEISFEFYVESDAWHFIYLKYVKQQQQGYQTNGLLNSQKLHQQQQQHQNQRHDWNGNLMLTSKIMQSSTITTSSSSAMLSSSSTMSSKSSNKTTTSHSQDNQDQFEAFYELDYSIQVDFHVEDDEPFLDSPNFYEPDRKPVIFRNIEFYPLLRQTYREFFMFDYDLLPDNNGSVPTMLNITAGQPIGFRFDVGDVYDIGGTLTFGLAMKRDIKGNDISAIIQTGVDSGGVIAEKLIGEKPNDFDYNNANDDNSNNNIEDEDDDKPPPRSNQTIIICMRLGEPGEPKWPDKCRYGRKLLPAAGIINNTDPDTSTGIIHVPFPESGQWYITMGLFCHGAETTARVTIIDSVKDFIKTYVNMLDTMHPPCSCSNFTKYYKNCIMERKCLSQMNETETLKIKECLMDSKCTKNYIDMTKKFEIHHKFATEQSVATEGCNSSLIFTISSSPCVAGRCGRYGRCYHYMSGGFVFSTCLCIKGYRGWDCTDDNQVPSSFSILIASLLLTLSNLLFIPSIYFAIRRKYYTESVIYFFAMFFSIFYHACDSGEDEYSFCLVKIGVLQFCDFYCGLLAIWVTLIAMSHIRQQFVSLLHMIGAIVLAFGTELNKQSLWVFLAPALTGLCLISVSWGMRCRKTRKCYPSRKYLIIYMPIGSLLAMIGLICYAFLQTKQNYHIVHSVWHMVMALSLFCLLPSRNSFLPKC